MKYICFLAWAFLFISMSFDFGGNMLSIVGSLTSDKDSAIDSIDIVTSFVGFIAIIYPIILMVESEKINSKWKKSKKTVNELIDERDNIEADLNTLKKKTDSQIEDLRGKLEHANSQTIESYETFTKLRDFEEIEKLALAERKAVDEG